MSSSIMSRVRSTQHNETLLGAACDYVRQGYACVSAQVVFDDVTGKKKVRQKPEWQQATPDTSLDVFFDAAWNGLALVTGDASDMLVVDIDNLKDKEVDKVQDGWKLVSALVDRHGLPPETPIAVTGSGGWHWCFSLSKSQSHGLQHFANRSKVSYNGAPTSIDVRGDRGCIFVCPTSYMAGRDPVTNQPVIKSYRWQSPLLPPEQLPAMPSWLIDILNIDHSGGAGNCILSPGFFDGKGDTNAWLTEQIGSAFIQRVAENLEILTNNKIDNWYIRSKGFDFKFRDSTLPCPCCVNNTHASNHYCCQKILTDCFMIKNYSKSCCTVVFEYERHPVISKILDTPATDNAYVEMLQLSHRHEGKEICNTLGSDGRSERFMCFDGNHWVEMNERTMQQHVRILADKVVSMLSMGISSQLKHTAKHLDDDKKERMQIHRKQLREAKKFIRRATNIHAITMSAKQLLWDEHLGSKLDQNPDVLGVPGGAIDLRTGELHRGVKEDYIATAISIEYRGVDLPTPDIDAFMHSLFEDEEVERFVQKLLGYAITAHTHEQKWLICHGSGSNGKGVLGMLLSGLLEKDKYYVSMEPDCLIKRERPQSKNAATPYLARLKGRRLAVCDELSEDAVLDDDIVKRATGESELTTRFLNGNPFTFQPIHFAILLTNHKPKVNVDDDAMMRRILFLPFNMQFKAEHDYDLDNPWHRRIDAKLKFRLQTDDCKSQLLTWLVKGAVKWYGEGLGEPPQVMQAAFSSYMEENDLLSKFLGEHCTEGQELLTDSVALLKKYNWHNPVSITASKLKAKMTARGFKYKNVSRVGLKRGNYYHGIALNEDT